MNSYFGFLVVISNASYKHASYIIVIYTLKIIYTEILELENIDFPQKYFEYYGHVTFTLTYKLYKCTIFFQF